MRSNITLNNSRFRFGISLALLLLFCFLFLSAQTATLLHAEIHEFHVHDDHGEHSGEHEEYCEIFDNLEKQSVILDTSSTLVDAIPFVSICPVSLPCNFIQASISAYDSRAPPVQFL